jgi:hypothetical protein
MIDWLVFNANFSSISAISLRDKFYLLTLTPTRPLEIKHTCLLNNRLMNELRCPILKNATLITGTRGVLQDCTRENTGVN